MAKLTLDSLLQKIQSQDDATRAAARDRASEVGADAIATLATIAATGSQEVARAANQALHVIVRHAGRPGADDEARTVSRQLLQVLDDSQPLQLRRDIIWMLWSIAGPEAVEPLAALLSHPQLAADARMALERLPGDQATVALQQALSTAAECDKPALTHSLRIRGCDL